MLLGDTIHGVLTFTRGTHLIQTGCLVSAFLFYYGSVSSLRPSERAVDV